VKNHYQFVLSPLSPKDWIGGSRVRAGVIPQVDIVAKAEFLAESNTTEPEEVHISSEFLKKNFDADTGSVNFPMDIKLLGAGMRRWILIVLLMCWDSCTSFRLDTGELQESFRALIPIEALSDDEVDDDEFAQALWGFFCVSDDGFSKVKLDGWSDGGVLLIDEPEAALHPEAVISIGRWLEDQAVSFGSVFVATHSLKVFDRDFPSLSRLALSVERLNPLQGVAQHRPRNHLIRKIDFGNIASSEWASKMGFTQGELMLLTKYMLLVEGPHDAILIEEFMGGTLGSMGVRVIPLHGLKRAEKSLIDGELAAELGIPMGILVDNYLPGRKSGEEKAVQRLLREHLAMGRSVDIFGLQKPDILDYLPGQIVNKRCEREFEGWEAARNLWKAIPAESNKLKVDFKSWVQSEYGVELNRESIRAMAYETTMRGLIDEEFFKLLDQLRIQLLIGRA